MGRINKFLYQWFKPQSKSKLPLALLVWLFIPLFVPYFLLIDFVQSGGLKRVVKNPLNWGYLMLAVTLIMLLHAITWDVTATGRVMVDVSLARLPLPLAIVGAMASIVRRLQGRLITPSEEQASDALPVSYDDGCEWRSAQSQEVKV